MGVDRDADGGMTAVEMRRRADMGMALRQACFDLAAVRVQAVQVFGKEDTDKLVDTFLDRAKTANERL